MAKLRTSCLAVPTMLLAVFTTRGFGQVVGADYAGNYGSWTDGSNAGSGLGNWTFRTDPQGGSAGTFKDTTNGDDDVRVGGAAFGLYANSGGGLPQSVVYRSVATPLPVGSSFHLTLDNPSSVISSPTGSFGFTIRNGNNSANAGDYNNQARFEFSFIGGDATWSIFDNVSSRDATGIGFSSSGFRTNLVRTGTDSYNFFVRSLSSGVVTSIIGRTLRTSTPGTSLDSIAIFNRNRGPDGYFNSLEVIGTSGLEWDGGGGNDNQSAGANWVGDLAPIDGDTLVFANSTRPTPNIDVVKAAQAISFKSGATGFTIGGNAISIAAGISNNSAEAQRINNAVTLLADQTVDAGNSGGSGALTIGSTINTSGKALTWTGSNAGTILGSISGAGSLSKTGAGVLTLPAGPTHTYAGVTNVTGGTLRVDSVLSGAGGAVTVGNGSPDTGILAGSGTVSRAVNINNGGSISPGSGQSGSSTTLANFTISTGALTLAPGGTLVVELNRRGDAGTAGVNWDTLTLSSLTVTADSGNKFKIKVIGLDNSFNEGAVTSWDPNVSQTWQIAGLTGSVTGFDTNAFEIDLSQFTNNNPVSANFYVRKDESNNLHLTYVPEPSAVSAVLLSSGLLLRRRRAISG